MFVSFSFFKNLKENFKDKVLNELYVVRLLKMFNNIKKIYTFQIYSFFFMKKVEAKIKVY